MINIDRLKKQVTKNLEESFVSSYKVIKKEVDLLNLAISSFGDVNFYSYDEYCKKRIEFEVQACDLIDINLEAEFKMSDNERFSLQMKTSDVLSVEEFDEITKSEYIKWQLKKIYNVEYKIFYLIIKNSSINLFKYKLSDKTWEKEKEFFEDICRMKAKNYAKALAYKNQANHKQNIIVSML